MAFLISLYIILRCLATRTTAAEEKLVVLLKGSDSLTYVQRNVAYNVYCFHCGILCTSIRHLTHSWLLDIGGLAELVDGAAAVWDYSLRYSWRENKERRYIHTLAVHRGVSISSSEPSYLRFWRDCYWVDGSCWCYILWDCGHCRSDSLSDGRNLLGFVCGERGRSRCHW